MFLGPEIVDRAIIGTTKRVNPTTNVVEWFRLASHGKKEPPPGAKENVVFATLPDRESKRLIFQMGTSDPDRAVEAARMVAADVDGIDVNAGCPKPFSTSGGMGAALLRTPDKLCAILEALVKNILPEYQIGITVKIRILETAAETEALVRRLVATGITGLTVHCRTTPMRPRERAIRGQLRMIADVCREAGVACLMNGDVESREEGKKLAEEFGANGAMIATAAEKNPSCFQTAEQGGLLPWKEVVTEYIKTAMAVENRFSNTKYLLTQMVPGKESAYRVVTQCKSYSDLVKALELDDLVEAAKVCDVARGLDQPPPPKQGKKGHNNPSAMAAGGQMRSKSEKKQKPLSERGSTKTEIKPEAVTA